MVRARPTGAVRGRAHGPARGGALDHRLLPPACARRLAARPVLDQHLRAARPGRATRRRRSRSTSRSPGITCRSRSRRSSTGCRRSGATSARPPTWRAGACTPSAWPTRWACTPATSTGSACCRSTPGAPRGSSSTPASTRSAGRASGRSSSCSTTRRSRENNVENEVDRYIVWPGQALAYKLGPAASCCASAPSATARSAREFDIRAFHDAVLGHGALPLPMLRAVIEAWAADATGPD